MFKISLPDNCAFEAIPPGVRHDDHPYPEEIHLANSFAAKRRESYLSGRLAAHRALKKLNLQDAPIGFDEHRQPIWPKGAIGSISHSNGWAIALVASSDDYLAVGLDLEKVSRYFPGLEGRVCNLSERIWCQSDQSSMPMRVIQIFSAKEAIYKAFFPLYRKYFGFEAVELVWDESRFLFVAKIGSEISATIKLPFEISLQQHVHEQFVVSYLMIPKSGANLK